MSPLETVINSSQAQKSEMSSDNTFFSINELILKKNIIN